MNLIKTMCQVQLIIKSQPNKGCCRGDSWKDETSIVLCTLGVRCTYGAAVGPQNTFSAYLDSDVLQNHRTRRPNVKVKPHVGVWTM